MSLGDFIKNYREEHDLSIRAFAALVGISHQYVGILESGINNDGKPVSPTMTTYKKIANALGMSEMELLSVVDDNVTVNPSASDEDKAILSALQRLSPDRKATFVELLMQLSNQDESSDGRE